MRKKNLFSIFTPLALLAILLMGVMTAQAATVVSQLGEQDFTDGQHPIFSAEITSAGSGEPFPFDGTIFGDDRYSGNFGSISFTHIFNVGGFNPVSAVLTIGLNDHDSYAFDGVPAPDTINVFFDGIQQPDNQFIGISYSPSSFSVVSMPVPVNLLLDGNLAVQIIAVASSPDTSLAGNSLGVDFSTLKISAGVVPLPSTILLLGPGLAALAGFATRRRRF